MSKIRFLVEDGTYHVYTRGNDGMVIFHDDFDKMVFLKKLEKLQEECGFIIYAYCLMSNHIHILFKDKGITLPDVMNSLLDYYAKYYNAKYGHKGHVFEGPYKSKIVIGFRYFFTLLRYILRNSIAAGMTRKMHEYKWASSKKELDFCNLIDFKGVMEMYSEYSEIPFNDFLENNEHDDMKCKIELFSFTLGEAADIFCDLLSLRTDTGKLEDLETEERNKLIQTAYYCGISKAQICTITGLSTKTVSTICSKNRKEYI